jgi:hypothetical protein
MILQLPVSNFNNFHMEESKPETPTLGSDCVCGAAFEDRPSLRDDEVKE